MTQKPPEIPQEIYARPDTHEGVWDTKPSGYAHETRYILPAPKEDVNRALEAFPDLGDHFRTWKTKTPVLSQEQYETIRRVLLANAGRR